MLTHRCSSRRPALVVVAVPFVQIRSLPDRPFAVTAPHFGLVGLTALHELPKYISLAATSVGLTVLHLNKISGNYRLKLV